MKEFKSVLKEKNFIYLWSSQIFSQLTINLMNFLILVKIITTTNSAVAASLLWIAYALPALLIGPFAAAIVDVWEKRKILILTNLLQAVVVFLAASFPNAKIFLLFGVVFLYSLLNQFYLPAEQSSLPSIISKAKFPFANSLFFITQQAAIVVGFGLAGPLLKLLKFTNSLYLCSGFLGIAFLSVVFLPEIKASQKLPHGLEKGVVEFFSKIMEGYSFIKTHNRILFPFLLLMGLQIGLVIGAVNTPLIGSEILKIAVTSIGIGVVVPTGIGAGIGAFIVPKMLKKGFRKKRIIEGSLIFTTVSLVLMATIVGFLGPVLKILVAFIILVIVGGAFVGMLIPAQTYLQEVTPGGLRGRVFGNFWFLVTIATIIPVLFSATITEILGVRTLVLFMGLITFLTFIFSRKYGWKLLLKSNNE